MKPSLIKCLFRSNRQLVTQHDSGCVWRSTHHETQKYTFNPNSCLTLVLVGPPIEYGGSEEKQEREVLISSHNHEASTACSMVDWYQKSRRGGKERRYESRPLRRQIGSQPMSNLICILQPLPLNGNWQVSLRSVFRAHRQAQGPRVLPLTLDVDTNDVGMVAEIQVLRMQ
jgi:hypothetical protein